MCYKVLCQQCGKFTWGGCGAHLKTLYPSIEAGKHCLCRPWPGVVIPRETPPAAAAVNPAASLPASTSSGNASDA